MAFQALQQPLTITEGTAEARSTDFTDIGPTAKQATQRQNQQPDRRPHGEVICPGRYHTPQTQQSTAAGGCRLTAGQEVSEESICHPRLAGFPESV